MSSWVFLAAPSVQARCLVNAAACCKVRLAYAPVLLGLSDSKQGSKPCYKAVITVTPRTAKARVY